MTETTKKHTQETVRKASEILDLDENIIAAALESDRFSDVLAETECPAAIRRILWLAPDRTCFRNAVVKLEDLLRPQIEAAETLDRLWEVASDAHAGLEEAVIAKQRSFVRDAGEAIALCEYYRPGGWQWASARAVVASFAQETAATGDYGKVHDLYEEIRHRLPECCGLLKELGDALERIQLGDLAEVVDWESALALLGRPIPRDRPAVARMTIEKAIMIAADVSALTAVIKHEATKNHQDLNRLALLKILDLVAG